MLKLVRTMMAVPAVFLLLALAGCAGPGRVRGAGVVEPGDVAQIRFLCWLKDGEVVATTDKAVEGRKDLVKSRVFLGRKKDGPVPVTAAGFSTRRPVEKELPFEEEIMERLARDLRGMKAGEARRVVLTARDNPERSAADYVLSIAKVRERPKRMEMTIDEFKFRTHGRTPVAGEPFIYDPAVPGRVESVTKKEVVLRFSAKPGTVVATPFGPGTIRETKDAYKIDIDARKGALVRTGPFVGRISGVDGDRITIDYRNPFGGKRLYCVVRVEKIEKKKNK